MIKSLQTNCYVLINNSTHHRYHQGKYVDVFCFNRYYGWYQEIGHTTVIKHLLSDEIEKWHKLYNKPIIMAEYGADTIQGEHMVGGSLVGA